MRVQERVQCDKSVTSLTSTVLLIDEDVRKIIIESGKETISRTFRGIS